MYGSTHEMFFNESDIHTANFIRSCRASFGPHSPFETFICFMSSSPLFFLSAPVFGV